MRVVKQETFSFPFLSLFFSSSSVVGLPSVPRFSDQFAAINARGPRGPTFSHTRARELSAARGRNRERGGGGSTRSTRHRQFNTWPKWFVGA